jgi:hypothetical protein
MTSVDYLLLTLLVIAVVLGVIWLGQPRKKRPRHRGGGRPLALARLNKSIDRRDWHARDFWAQVVHAIHDQQRSGPPNNAANDRRTRRLAEARAQRR